MHEVLITAERELDLDLGNLRIAAAHSQERIDDARASVEAYLAGVSAERVPGEPIIAAFGSMARQEMAQGSDFDFLVILRSLERDPATIRTYRGAAAKALKELGIEPPGSSGLFGGAISGTDLVNTIGLDQDTNLHLSRRILLLEESIALCAEDGYRDLIEAVCARYLHESPSHHRVPRFLLNDVIRYWRTITVDYQAKRWDEMASNKWGARYVKLISTRKLTYAGMLISLFWGSLNDQVPDAAMLQGQFSLPSLARIAQLAPLARGGTRDALRNVLELADWFNGQLAQAEIRSSYRDHDNPAEAPDGHPLDLARTKGRALQAALERLFYSDENLVSGTSIGPLARAYLAF